MDSWLPGFYAWRLESPVGGDQPWFWGLPMGLFIVPREVSSTEPFVQLHPAPLPQCQASKPEKALVAATKAAAKTLVVSSRSSHPGNVASGRKPPTVPKMGR